jgi:hypothetical protein
VQGYVEFIKFKCGSRFIKGLPPKVTLFHWLNPYLAFSPKQNALTPWKFILNMLKVLEIWHVEIRNSMSWLIWPNILALIQHRICRHLHKLYSFLPFIRSNSRYLNQDKIITYTCCIKVETFSSFFPILFNTYNTLYISIGLGQL